jgi:hypothetical protein
LKFKVVSRHASHKPTCFFVFDKREPNAYMAATLLGASEVLGDFIKVNVAMNDLYKKLYRALQPYMQAPHTSRLDDEAIVQIPQGSIFKPCHQKSSADGIRL